jgi:Na+-driven multidrug efflux pump
MGSLAMNNLLRFQGLAVYGMVGIITGGILNMLLDPLLIFVFDMGITGAAVATAVSQLISFVILLVMCNTHAEALSILPKNYRPTAKMYGKILNNGLPSLGRQGIMSVSTSLLNNAAAVYGDPAIAAFSIVNRCLNFIYSTVVGFGQGFQPVCGFNYGAKKFDRMHRAFFFSVKVTTIVLLVLGVLGFAFAEPIVTAFRRSDLEVIRIGTETFRVQILTAWTWGMITLSNMYTQAIGYGIRSTILSAARQGLFLIPVLLVLPKVFGLQGLEYCQPVADVLTLALSVIMMAKVMKEK